MKAYLWLAVFLSFIPTNGVALSPQSKDISGTWVFSINMARGSGEETFTIKQQGEVLTGNYKGRFGEKSISGTVKGNRAVGSAPLVCCY